MNFTSSYRYLTKPSSFRWFSNSTQTLSYKSKNKTIKYSSNRKKLSASSSRWLQRQQKDPYAKMAKKEGSPSRSIYKLEQIDKRLSKKGNKKNQSSLFRPGQTIIDLGAAPGGWSHYASKKVGSMGTIVAVDLLPMDSSTINSINQTSNFHVITGDFKSMKTKQNVMKAIILSSNHDGDDYDDTEDSMNWNENMTKHQQQHFLHRGRADVIMSDMAANFTGDQITDALRTISLCEHALAFAVGSPSNNEGSYPLHQIGLLNIGGTFLCKFFSCGRQHEHDLRDSVQHHFQHHTVIKPPASRKESSEQYLLATGYQGNHILQQSIQDEINHNNNHI